MGFFSDLKEDLNQAVNELMPGDKVEPETKAGAKTEPDPLLQENMDDEETLKQLAELENILQNMDLPKQGNEKAAKAAEPDSMAFEELGSLAEGKLPDGAAPAGLDAEDMPKSLDSLISEFMNPGDQAETKKVTEADAEEEKAPAMEQVETAETAQEMVWEQMELSQVGGMTEAETKEETAEIAEETAKKATPESEMEIAKENAMETETESIGVPPIALSEEDAKIVGETDEEMNQVMGEFQDAVAALKDSVEEQKAKEEESAEAEPAPDGDNLEEELRATFGAREGEETVEDYLHEEAIRTGADIIDKSWVLDLKGMETMDETAIITAGMRVKGDILSNGSADISGEVIGNIQIKGKLNITGKVNGNSKAQEIFADSARVQGDMISDNTVKIGVDSVVIGNIEATSAVIAGAVKGTIDVKGPVILDTTAVVLGNVRAKSMQINNGARIEGMCVLCYAEQSAAKFFEEQAGF